MEDFLDDIGAEVEVNPDEVEVVKKKKPKKTRLLRKDEKKALLSCMFSSWLAGHLAMIMER